MTAETKPSPASDPEEPPKTGRIPRWVIATATLALTVGIVGVILFYGYQTRPGWVGVADKKFWDYLELLIVPAALAIGVYLLNRAQSEREREAEEAQQERERRAEEAHRERELEVENQRAQDEALQAYLDQMSQLLTDKERPLHRSQVGDSLSTLARARALTVLTRLDGNRKGSVVQFLYESGLIDKDRLILNVSGSDLSGANLREANLRGAYLIYADLSEADLSGTDLSGAYLRGANLRAAYLSGANLINANLIGANLINANLIGAYLSGAGLIYANLRGANLIFADLIGAVGLTNEMLDQQAKSLLGATMPNGQKYEDWLKSKGRGEDGENSGP